MKSWISTCLMGLVAIMFFAVETSAQNTPPVIWGVDSDVVPSVGHFIDGFVADNDPWSVTVWIEIPSTMGPNFTWPLEKDVQNDGVYFWTADPIPFPAVWGTDMVIVYAWDGEYLDVEVVDIPF